MLFAIIHRQRGGLNYQWEEGDVSCSVVRRVILPDAFYASDGLCETTLNVLNEMGTYPAVIDAEVDRYLPFLATTEVLRLATQHGLGREEAHKVIKRHVVAEALAMREKGKTPCLAERLATDSEFQSRGITRESLDKILQKRTEFIGNAYKQMNTVISSINCLTRAYPEEAVYELQPIL